MWCSCRWCSHTGHSFVLFHYVFSVHVFFPTFKCQWALLQTTNLYFYGTKFEMYIKQRQFNLSANAQMWLWVKYEQIFVSNKFIERYIQIFSCTQIWGLMEQHIEQDTHSQNYCQRSPTSVLGTWVKSKHTKKLEQPVLKWFTFNHSIWKEKVTNYNYFHQLPNRIIYSPWINKRP